MPQKNRMVHVSFDIVDEFVPRIPRQRADGEDSTTPRICVSDSISHSLNAMVDAGKALQLMQKLGLPLVVHAYYLTSENVLDNNVVQRYVPDAALTKEAWVLSKPEKVYRVDYIIEEPYFVQVGEKKHTIIAGISLKRTKFSDNVQNLAEKYGCDVKKLKALMTNFGFAEMICNIGERLLEIQIGRTGEKKIA